MDIGSMLFLFLSVVLSGFIILYIKLSDKMVQMLLSFSGAFILALTFTQIIPEVFGHNEGTNLGYYVLLGFFIQIIIEYFSGGIDHGHHHHEHDESGHHHEKMINPLPLLIGISMHAFFEGMPFSGHEGLHDEVQHSLLLGVVIHKIPIAIVLMSLFISAGYKKIKAISLISIFALAAPLGSLASHFAGNFFQDKEYFYHIIMALVIGIFLHISTVILFEGDKSHKFNLMKFITILIGVLTAIGIHWLH